MSKPKPKLLVLDIETRPSLSYHWRMFKENIGIDQVVEPGSILCICAKWVGQREVLTFSEWEHGEKGMLQAVHDLISEADAVIGKNSIRFDIPWLMTQFLKNKMPPPPPITHIDLEKTARYQMRFLSNKLDFIVQYLGIGKKVDTGGFKLWREVMDGKESARKKMLRYCAGDVRVTERLYVRMRPYITNHPHMSTVKGTDCGACFSDKLQSRGFRRTKTMRIQRLHCTNCGSWQDGKREKVV